MQNRQYLLWLAIVLFTSSLYAQTTYLPLWSKEAWLLDRLEIKAQSNIDLNLSMVKPYMRKAYVAVADSIRQSLMKNQNPFHLTEVDKYNLNRLQANSSEYSAIKDDRILKTWQNESSPGGFFQNRANAIEVNRPDFYMVVNPAVSLQQSRESDYDKPVYFRAFGASVRGLIHKRIGFNFQATANSEAGPLPFRRFYDSNQAVPGTAWFTAKDDSSSFSYGDFRGSLNWNVTKYINMQVGRDEHFIGSGYRSLYLSNFSGPSNFVKINTRIWKLNYTNLYTQFAPSPDPAINKALPKKYSSMHHLSVNVTKWLTVGGFEAIVFGRDNGYDLAYALPVIFLRSMEQQNGSPDNANIGFDFKANILKRLQAYGVLMLDEFVKDELVGQTRYWWGNKQAFQLGAKYIDAFGVKNLDLQAEMNQVRPFMYQFRDTSGAYTHAFQPLAHPLGGNLREVVGVVRWQPMERLYFHGRFIWWKQGLDSAGLNFGSNPNEDYSKLGSGGTRPRDDNFPMFCGMPSTGINAALMASYELAENMFVDLNLNMRSFQETQKEKVTTSLFSLGFRWNMFRRDYDY